MIKFTNKSINNAGYIRDLAIISLAYGLLYVSDDIERNGLENYDGLVVTKEFEYPDGFKEMLADTVTDVKDDIRKLMERKEHGEIVKKVKDKSNAMLKNAMNRLMKEDVSLDVLAMYILYDTFYKREKPLHENFRAFSDSTRYEFIVNTYDSVGFSLRSKLKMRKLARDCKLF